MAVEGREMYIHRKSHQMDREINLLFIHEDGINHYTAIKTLADCFLAVILILSVNNISALPA